MVQERNSVEAIKRPCYHRQLLPVTRRFAQDQNTAGLDSCFKFEALYGNLDTEISGIEKLEQVKKLS